MKNQNIPSVKSENPQKFMKHASHEIDIIDDEFNDTDEGISKDKFKDF